MASKLELRFTGPGELGTMTVAAGMNYTFRFERLGPRQVAIGKDAPVPALQLARNFLDAFTADDNYLGVFTVGWFGSLNDADGNEIVGDPHGIVTIEHPQNDFFDAHFNENFFVTSTITTTPEVPKDMISLALGQAADPCGKFNLSITSTTAGNTVTVENPIGNVVYEYQSTIGEEVVELLRPYEGKTGVVKSNGQEVVFTAPPVLTIANVAVTGSPFGAAVLIETTNVAGRTYSLNGVDFQGSREFTGLLAGNYTAYAKDGFGCLKTRSFEVTEEHVSGLTVPPYIEVPIHNALRFANSQSGLFLKDLAHENNGYIKLGKCYQEYLVGDSIREQFKSAYPSHRVYAIDKDGVETELTLIKKSNNISRRNIYEGNYANIEGRLAVYFTSGNVFNPDGSVKDAHVLNGLLPIWYEEGMFISIEGIGPTQIDRIYFDEDAEITYAITQMDGVGPGLGKKITSIHTAHPYEVYEFELNLLEENTYQVVIDYSEGYMISELIRSNTELQNYLRVEWHNKSNNAILFGTGIRPFRRLKWEKYFSLIPRSDKQTYDTDTTVELSSSKSFSVYEVVFDRLPMELARGLVYALDNSSEIIIEGVRFVCENPVKLKEEGQWYFLTAEFTLIDQTMNGQQEIVDVIDVGFLAVEVNADGISFLRV